MHTKELNKMLNEKQIEALEKVGFNRWTKNGMDRLYASKEAMQLELTYYKTGNISSAALMGEKISNSRARKLIGEKIYIDVETGELTSKYDDVDYELMNAVRETAEKALAEVKEETKEEPEEEPEEEHEMVDLTGTEKQVAWASKIRAQAVEMAINAADELSTRTEFWDMINSETEARWWIDNREEFGNLSDLGSAFWKAQQVAQENS